MKPYTEQLKTLLDSINWKMPPRHSLLLPPKLVFYLDASAFKRSNCDLRTRFTVVDGYKSPYKDFKMEYGTAFHKFLASFLLSHDVKSALTLAESYYESIDVPVNDFRTLNHLRLACLMYAKEFSHDSFIAEQTECKLQWKYYEDSTVKIILCGTLDAIGKLDGLPIFMDHKTTAAWSKDNFLKGFGLSPQLMFYLTLLEHGTTLDGKKLSGASYAMINGIFLTPVEKGIVSFKRSLPLEFTVEKLQNFRRSLDTWVKRFRTNLESDTWSPNYLCCEEGLGFLCPYFSACDTPSKEDRNSILKLTFNQESYDQRIFQT